MILGQQPRFIETVRGRGYRFLGGIEEGERAESAEARRKLGTHPPSLAVLPFTNLSGDPEQEYFSDGITEDIITELSRFRSLFVIARNSSFTYKDRAANVQDIGRDLGVRYVVEGSVRRAGQRVRVTRVSGWRRGRRTCRECRGAKETRDTPTVVGRPALHQPFW